MIAPKKCRCGCDPEIVDGRVVFFVRCSNHRPPLPVVYGESHRYIDYIEDDKEAQLVCDSVNWAKAEESAVINWNNSEHVSNNVGGVSDKEKP